MTAVEVCPICDIAGCRHIRERKAKMTHQTNEELDALVQMLQQRNKSKHGYTGHPLYNRDGLQAAAAITALRAQLAGANASADRAEAERAAQIEADAGLLQAVADNWDCGCDSRYCRCAELAEQWDLAADEIRAQPHDRTALDRMLAEARAQALRDAAHVAVNACLVPPDGGNPTEDERLVCEEAYRRILAMIERGK